MERVIAAMVLESFLNEILPTYNSWKTKYVAGNNSGLQSQTRKKQNKTVEDFRKGLVWSNSLELLESSASSNFFFLILSNLFLFAGKHHRLNIYSRGRSRCSKLQSGCRI